MSRGSRVQASRVIDEAGRRQVVEVLRATYQREKRWVTDPEPQAPPSDLERDEICCSIFARHTSGSRPTATGCFAT